MLKCLCFYIVEISLHRCYFSANGYYLYTWTQCIYISHHLDDMEYIEGYYFNKYPDIKFNSTVGMFEGFSDFGIRTAELWNNNTAILQETRAKVDTYCKPNAEVFEAAIHSKKGM